MSNRRQFLVQGIGGFAGFLAIDSIFARAARAAVQSPASAAGTSRTLLVVNFQGGNDGLNTLVPYGDPTYYSVRPTINIPQDQVVKLDSMLGLHPQLAALKPLYDQQRIAILQGVHYPNPNLSHFRSTEIWQTAAPEKYVDTGWAGRYLDAQGKGQQPNLFAGVAVGPVLPKVMVAERTDVPTIADPRAFKFNGTRGEQAAADNILGGDGYKYPFQSPYLQLVQDVESHAHAAANELPHLVAGYKPAVEYPKTPFAQGLNLIAGVVNANVGTKVFYISLGSFDTHVGQRNQQDRLLDQFSAGIAAFYQDLAAHNADSNVLTMTFSEFGRRVQENANRGTDHGTAAPMFLIGGNAKGGIYGDHPSLTDLDYGNLKWHTDFRSVYATILERWLGIGSAPILGSQFETLTVV